MLTQAHSEHFPLNLRHVFGYIYKITDALKTLRGFLKKLGSNFKDNPIIICILYKLDW